MELFPNPSIEEKITNEFICTLYLHGCNNYEIENEGMDPFEIWKILKYKAFLEPIIPSILNRLITNGVRSRFITFDNNTRKVRITGQGKKWCEKINCRGMPGVAG